MVTRKVQKNPLRREHLTFYNAQEVVSCANDIRSLKEMNKRESKQTHKQCHTHNFHHLWLHEAVFSSFSYETTRSSSFKIQNPSVQALQSLLNSFCTKICNEESPATSISFSAGRKTPQQNQRGLIPQKPLFN